MKQTIINHDTFDPSVLAMLRKSFDDVWDQIGPRTDDESRERVKEAVADAIMTVARLGQKSPEQIFIYALSKAHNALV